MALNLTKNVDGTWEQAKFRLRADLDMIQRTLNQVQTQINTIEAEVPTPPAVISSANTVTTFEGDFLTTVAVKPLGGLEGKGIITDPLAISVDGSTTSINGAGQLVAAGGISSVTTDPAGALSGNGTGGSPLAVKVDGSTISINGSNQLVAAITAPNLQTVTIPITAAGLVAVGTGTFATPIVGVSNKLIAIVSWGYQMAKNANSFVGGAGNLRLRYSGTTIAAANTLPLALNNTTAGSTGASAFGASTGWGSLSTDLLALGVQVSCDSSLSASGGVPAPTASGTITIAYYMMG